LLDSDNVPSVPQAGLDELRSILPALARTARVSRWFGARGEQPAELELALTDGRVVLAIINWARRKRNSVVTLAGDGAWHVYDFWRGRYLGVFRNRVPLPRQMPHETIVLQCAPAGYEPSLIGSSFHLTSADVLDVARRENGLQISLGERIKGSGEIVIALGAEQRIRRAMLGDIGARVRHSKEGIARVYIPGGGPGILQIEFA